VSIPISTTADDRTTVSPFAAATVPIAMSFAMVANSIAAAGLDPLAF